VAKGPGITGIQHVAVLTPRLEDAERHYAQLFEAEVQFRSGAYEGDEVAVDARYDWETIRRSRLLKLHATFLRAGALTIVAMDEPAGKDGALGHVCIACTDPELRRIREQVGALGLREYRDAPGVFRFRDAFGVLWEAARSNEEAHRPSRTLDLGSGRVT
jgi:catechol 2,3-dioxygenase-like lactoylglutathione lyase family enzyme